jgi:5-methyltetrahydrofolate--homocysteine methyltransferase
MAAALREFEVDVLGINCGRSLEDNLNALQALKEATDKPIWFKPNAGLPTLDPQGVPVYDVQPADMAAKVPQWLAAGANIIGGCCGTTPQHVHAIAQAAKSFAQ